MNFNRKKKETLDSTRIEPARGSVLGWFCLFAGVGFLGELIIYWILESSGEKDMKTAIPSKGS